MSSLTYEEETEASNVEEYNQDHNAIDDTFWDENSDFWVWVSIITSLHYPIFITIVLFSSCF